MKLLLISLSLLLLAPNFVHSSLEGTPVFDRKERFDSSLTYINSIDKLIQIADSAALINHISQGTLQYAITVSTIIRNRFYHGFSHYSLNENWIAALSEHCLGYGLSSPVTADDILKHSYGGCSQQSIVLMEVMHRKNISYRSIGFPHHYASELFFNNSWYFFDPNMEPTITDSQRSESNWHLSVDSLKKYYDRTHYPDLDWKFGNNQNVTTGNSNANVAPRAKIFQAITGYLSKSLWILPIIFVFSRKRNRST